MSIEIDMEEISEQYRGQFRGKSRHLRDSTEKVATIVANVVDSLPSSCDEIDAFVLAIQKREHVKEVIAKLQEIEA